MKFAEFKDELKTRKYHPVYFFAGDEACLIDDGLDLLIAALVTPENRDFNFDVLYGSEVPASRVIEIATSFPMLSDHRTVIVRDLQKMSNADLTALAAYAGRPNRTTHLILAMQEKDLRKKALDKLKNASCFVDCAPLYDSQVPAWIRQEVKKHGCTITEEAAQWMANEVGNNLLYLRSEIEKLRLFLGDRKEITDDDVAAVTGSRREFTIYALQNAIGEKNISGALRILDRLLQQKMNAGGIVYGLSRHFGNMYVAHGFGRGREDMAQLAARTKINQFFIPQLVRAARAYSIAEIAHALEVLRLCDYSLKTQSLSELLTLRLAIITIVRQVPLRYLPFVRSS
jgi:DNA polymerase-3 subunit delta